MSRPQGNWRLKAARLARGLASQQALADALTEAGEQLGIDDAGVGQRQVRRWESSAPPWPQPMQQRLLQQVLGCSIADLGFTPPWVNADEQNPGAVQRPAAALRSPRDAEFRAPARRHRVEHPLSAASDFEQMTVGYRHFYRTTDPHRLHPAVVEHVRLGQGFLSETGGSDRERIARASAESALLAGRIEFFDLREPDRAIEHFMKALQFAGAAQDSLLGAAILAHCAFVPGWDGDRDSAVERLTAARAHARRGQASPLFDAWIDSVEAECLTRCGDPAGALRLLDHAEAFVGDAAEDSLPEWMDWFGTVRLLTFKGNTLLTAGRHRRARSTLVEALERLPARDSKQRAVVLADLAAVEVADSNPVEACRLLQDALTDLSRTWYAVGMDRIRAVRKSLRPWQHDACVIELDGHLFGWESTLTTMRR